MTNPFRSRSGLVALALALAASGSALSTSVATAAPGDSARTNAGATTAGQSYDRLIVHFASSTAAATSDAAAQSEVDAVGRDAGQRLTVTRRLSTGGALVQVATPLDKPGTDALLARFVERSGVAYAEVDALMSPTLTPTDPLYTKQWHYYEPVAGMNLPGAWDTATGTGVVVAVLDTGITVHPDLDANVIAGYDFVSNATFARDGNGRDSNPADQGDWTTRNQCYGGSQPTNSTWHGTHVSGTVAAVNNNGVGVTGVAYGAKVQPVRVLAACGGTLADIADAITWASGGTVSGVPANPTPAKVINMSLGGGGTCGATYQNAINGAVARGTIVIVAAGNSNGNAASYQPSSCTSTVVVAASDREGNRASYSNYGAIVDLTAPGGETATAANGVASTLNSGTTIPGTPNYVYYQGTSMATPHVAGMAALVLGKRSYTPADLESVLKAGVRPLAGTCTGGCGTGLVDATKTIASVPAV